MADQRRRRGRSGRGGRIPRKGDMASMTPVQSETFVSFPLEATGPISVSPPLAENALSTTVGKVLALERQYHAALARRSGNGGDGWGALSRDASRHLESLEKLADEVAGAREVASRAGEPGLELDEARLLAHLELLRVAWLCLQRLAYAIGSPQLEQLTQPVLHEKDRHATLLRELAVRAGSRVVFCEPEY